MLDDYDNNQLLINKLVFLKHAFSIKNKIIVKLVNLDTVFFCKYKD